MFKLFVIGIIKPLVFPLYCFCTWTLVGLFFVSLWKAGRDGIAQLKRLHQIPCDQCVFFTGDYRLKCTVHPIKALSEEAIDCLDFQSTSPKCYYCSQKIPNQFGNS